MTNRFIKWVREQLAHILFGTLIVSLLLFMCLVIFNAWKMEDEQAVKNENAPPNMYGVDNEIFDGDDADDAYVMVKNKEGRILCSYHIPDDRDYTRDQARVNNFGCTGNDQRSVITE